MKCKLSKCFLIFLIIFFMIGCNAINRQITIKLYSDYENPSEVIVNKGDTLDNLTEPTKENNEFLGWFYDEKLTNPVKWPLTVNDDISLYAKWKYYTITWLNYDGTIIKQEQVLAGEILSYSGEIPIKPGDDETGYIFNGFDLDYIENVYKDFSFNATYEEVKVRISDLYTEANNGNLSAIKALVRLYEDYDSDDSYTALKLIDTAALAELAEEGVKDSYYYLNRLVYFQNETAKENLSNFDLSNYIDKANQGDTRAFYFLEEYYKKNNLSGYEVFNQMEAEAYLDNPIFYNESYSYIVNLAFKYDNAKAMAIIEESIANASITENYIIFSITNFYGYDVTNIIDKVNVDNLSNAYAGETNYYAPLLKYLVLYGNTDAYDVLIDYSYDSWIGVEALIGLLYSNSAEKAILDLMEIAKYGNEKAIDFFLEQACFSGNDFYDEGIEVLIALVYSGDYLVVNDIINYGIDELLFDLSIEKLIDNIKTNSSSSSEKYFDILRILHENFNNTDGYLRIIDLIAEGNQEAAKFIINRYDQDTMEPYLVDYLFALLDSEENKFLLAFTFQLMQEGWDFYTNLEETQLIDYYDRYIKLMDSEEDFIFITEIFNPIFDLSVIVNNINEGNIYALKILHLFMFTLCEIDISEYGIDYDYFIDLAESGDFEVLKILIDLNLSNIVPDSDLVLIDISMYYSLIYNQDVSLIGYTSILSQRFDNPYANQIINHLRSDGIVSVLDLFLSTGTFYDYYALLPWVLTYIYGDELYDSAMHNLDLTPLFLRIEAGDIEAYDLFMVLKQNENISMLDEIDSINVSNIVEVIEDGDFRICRLLFGLAEDNSNQAALSALSTIEMPEFSETYYDENSYDNFVVNTLHKLAVEYNNYNALETIVIWSFKDSSTFSQLLLILEESYEYIYADELITLLTDYYPLEMPAHKAYIYKDMIVSGNDLVLDIVSKFLREKNLDARYVLSWCVSLEYESAINEVIRIAESGSEYAVDILIHNNLDAILSELDVASYVPFIEQLHEGWESLYFTLIILANDYGNSNAIYSLTNLDPIKIINYDLNDIFFSFAGLLSNLVHYNNQTAIEMLLEYAYEGNEEVLSILFRIPMNNSTTLSNYKEDILYFANQNNIYAIDYLFYLVEQGETVVYDDIIVLLNNNIEHAIMKIFNYDEQAGYEDELISLIQKGNIIVIEKLLDLGYEFTETTERDILVENGYID